MPWSTRPKLSILFGSGRSWLRLQRLSAPPRNWTRSSALNLALWISLLSPGAVVGQRTPSWAIRMHQAHGVVTPIARFDRPPPRIGGSPSPRPDTAATSFGQRFAFAAGGMVLAGFVASLAASDLPVVIAAAAGGAAPVLLITSRREGIHFNGTVLGTLIGAAPALFAFSRLEGYDRIIALASVPGIPLGAAFGSDWGR